MSYGWPTVRRFPRSLLEAFPRDHAEAVTYYPSPRSWILSDIAVAIIFVCVLVALAFGVL